MTTPHRYVPAVLFLALTLGCSGEPKIVYVPGDGYQESIHVATEQGPEAVVDVGEPLTLHVTRRSGPWVETDAAELDDDVCRLVNPPDPTELEVADNVTWVADPQEDAIASYKHGDVVMVRPAGHKWTKTERNSFLIVQLYMTEEEAAELGKPQEIDTGKKDKSGRPIRNRIKRRARKFDMQRMGLPKSEAKSNKGKDKFKVLYIF